MRRNFSVIASAPACAITLLLVLMSGGCKKDADAAKAQAAPPDVEVIAVQPSDVSITYEWIGTTDGFVNADIRARVTGYLQSQTYTDGARVSKGDLLFQIDPRPFEASLALAKAELAKSQADQKKTQLDVDRLTPLVPHAVSQQELDNAVAANAANLAMIEASKANIETAQLNLEFTKIVAPVDGIAGIAQAQIGDLVGQGSGPLTTLSTLDPIKVTFSISEQEYMRAVERGTAEAAKPIEQRDDVFQLFLADGSEFAHRGKFYSINRQVNVGTGTIEIVGIFPNPGSVLRPGQFARVKAVGRVEKGVLLVPQRAVNDLQGTYQVVVVGSDNKAEIRTVKMGERVGSDWIVLSGLEPGDGVVVEGLQKVRNNAPVNPKPYQSPTQPIPAAAARAGAGGAASAKPN